MIEVGNLPMVFAKWTVGAVEGDRQAYFARKIGSIATVVHCFVH